MSFLRFFKRNSNKSTSGSTSNSVVINESSNNIPILSSYLDYSKSLDRAPFISSIVNLYSRFLNQTSLQCTDNSNNIFAKNWNYAPSLNQSHSSFCNSLIRGWINGLALIVIDRSNNKLTCVSFDSISNIQSDNNGGINFLVDNLNGNLNETINSEDALVLPFNDNGNIGNQFNYFDVSNYRLIQNDLILLIKSQNLVNNILSNYPSLFKLSGSVNSTQYKNVSEQIEQNLKVQQAVQKNLSESNVISIPDGFDLTVMDNNNYLQSLSQLNANISQIEMNIANFFQVPIGCLSNLEHVHTANNSASDDYTFFYGAFSSLLRQIQDELNIKLKGKGSNSFKLVFDGELPTNPALKITEQIDNGNNN